MHIMIFLYTADDKLLNGIPIQWKTYKINDNMHYYAIKNDGFYSTELTKHWAEIILKICNTYIYVII